MAEGMNRTQSEELNGYVCPWGCLVH